MSWKRVLAVLAIALVAAPAAPVELIGSVAPFGSGANVGTNTTVACPAYLYLNVLVSSGAHIETVPLSDVQAIVSWDAGASILFPSENTIPLKPSVTIDLTIGPKNDPVGVLWYEGSFTSGACGEWRVMNIEVSDEELYGSSFFSPIRVSFRLYDATTGAGLPPEAFNITAEFPGYDNGLGTVYTMLNETALGLPYLDTYANLNVTVRVRDYFGNLLYNQTRKFYTNFSTDCGSGACPPWLRNQQTWDIPLSVYSFKVYNQKPDQFIKTKLYWNGTGAGEEVYAPNSGLFPWWWNSDYAYRQRLRINTTTDVMAGYDLNLSLAASSYVSSGKILADYRDLRVVYWNGSDWVEVTRSYDGSNLKFEAQALDTEMPLAPANGSWHFEEGTGTTAADFSGNGLTATLFSGPTWATGRYGTGYSVTLDGSNDYIQATGSSTVEFRAGDFTVEAWFLKPSTTTGYDNWFGVAKWNTGAAPGTNEWVLALGDADGTGEKPSFEIESGATTYAVESSGAISLNSWTHLAGVREGTNTKIYMNGVLVGTQAIGTVAVNEVASRKVTIGISDGLVDSGFHAAFSVDDVRIYNYSRTADQIACDAGRYCVAINDTTTTRDYWLYYGNQLAGAAPAIETYKSMITSTSGIKLYWRMEETSGTAEPDVSGNGQTGTIGTAVTKQWPGSMNDSKAYFFPSSPHDSTTRITSTNAFTDASLTLESWVKVSGTDPGYRPIIGDRETASDFNAMLYIIQNTLTLRAHVFNAVGSQVTIDSTLTLIANEWNHVVQVADSTGLHLYINGREDGNSPASMAGQSVRTSNANTWKVGNDPDGTTVSFNGYEDEAAIYSSALTGTAVYQHYKEGLEANNSTVATVALDSSQGFEWFQSPGETVERFLNPGYYQIQIVTDNRTGVQTKANLGVNITETNYYMVSGTNITRFIGDFASIYFQTQVIANAFRPDVIHYGDLLPTAPTTLRAMSVDEDAVLDDPFSVLTGTAAYGGAAGTNVTSFAPNMSSEGGIEGSLLTTVTVLKDEFVFSGAEPSITHLWINWTSNGTNIYESSTLPPSLTLAGIGGDVYVVTNRSVQTTRISDFRAVWTFSTAYYPTTKRYEVTLSLNNSMNRTVYNPYWFIAFPENKSINITSAAVKDIDNDVWLQKGQNFEVAQGGYYMTFDGLNASTVRHFFFQFFDLNSTVGQSTIVRQVSQIDREAWRDSSAYWSGTASFSHEFAAPYNGDLVIKFTCAECTRIRWETLELVDETSGRKLDATEFLAGGGSVTIIGSSVGELGVGEVRTYKAHFQLELTPAPSEFSIYAPFIVFFGVAISIFLLTFGATLFSLLGYFLLGGRAEGQQRKDRRQAWFAAFVFLGFMTVLMYMGRPEGMHFFA